MNRFGTTSVSISPNIDITIESVSAITGGGTATLPAGIMTSVAAAPTTITTIPIFSTDTTGTKLDKSNATISSAGLINVPTGGSYRINNIPLPVIDNVNYSHENTFSSVKIRDENSLQDVQIVAVANYASNLINNSSNNTSNTLSSSRIYFEIGKLINDTAPSAKTTLSSNQIQTLFTTLSTAIGTKTQVSDGTVDNFNTLSSGKIKSEIQLLINDTAVSATKTFSSNQTMTVINALGASINNLGARITVLETTVAQLVADVNVLKNPPVAGGNTFATVKAGFEPAYNALLNDPNYYGIVSTVHWTGQTHLYIVTTKYYLVSNNNLMGIETKLFNINTNALSEFNWNTNTYTTTELNNTSSIPESISPTVVISINSGGLMSAIGDTRTIDILFSEPVINFISTDISLTGLTLSAFTFNGTSGSFTATSTANKSSVVINTSVCTDPAGNNNTASNTLSVKEGYSILSTQPTTHKIDSIASSANGAIIIVGSDEANVVHKSIDYGATWTNVPANGITNLYKAAMSNNGRYHIMGGNQGVLYSSDYGVSYITITTAYCSVAMNSDGSKVAYGVNNGLIYVSTNGGAYTSVNSGIGPWLSLAISDNGLVIVGAISGGRVMITTNGSNFYPRDTYGNSSWQDVACSADGAKIMLCNYDGANGGLFQSSDYGATFTNPGLSGNTWGCSMSSDGVNRIVATDNGHFRSSDSGVSYEKISGNFGTGGIAGFRTANISSDGSRGMFSIDTNGAGLYAN